MKIAVFHELPYGGARRAVLEFGRVLMREHEVDLYYLDDKRELKAEKIFNKSKFIKFVPKNWKGKDWRSKLYKDTIELYNLYKIHKKIAKEIDEKKYDFVIVHASKYTEAPFVLRFLKTKSVYYCQEPLRMVYEDLFENWDKLSFGKKVYEKTNKFIRKNIDRKNIFRADILLTTSINIQKYIKRVYGLNAKVSYMGVDNKIFYPLKTKKKYDLLFIGSREELDGYPLLIESLKLMKRKYKLRNIFYEDEWIDGEKEMRKIYSESKIHLAFAKNEPFGLVPLEAAACKTTTVAVSEGGYPETIINNKTGILVKRDPRIVAKTLDSLLKNDRKIRSLSQNAYEEIEKKWTWKVNTKKLLENIQSGDVIIPR